MSPLTQLLQWQPCYKIVPPERERQQRIEDERANITLCLIALVACAVPPVICAARPKYRHCVMPWEPPIDNDDYDCPEMMIRHGGPARNCCDSFTEHCWWDQR